MIDFNDSYEPDEILRDVDSDVEFDLEDEFDELSFENKRDADEGLTFLLNDIDSPAELFAE